MSLLLLLTSPAATPSGPTLLVRQPTATVPLGDGLAWVDGAWRIPLADLGQDGILWWAPATAPTGSTTGTVTASRTRPSAVLVTTVRDRGTVTGTRGRPSALILGSGASVLTVADLVLSSSSLAALVLSTDTRSELVASSSSSSALVGSAASG